MLVMVLVMLIMVVMVLVMVVMVLVMLVMVLVIVVVMVVRWQDKPRVYLSTPKRRRGWGVRKPPGHLFEDKKRGGVKTPGTSFKCIFTAFLQDRSHRPGSIAPSGRSSLA